MFASSFRPFILLLLVLLPASTFCNSFKRDSARKGIIIDSSCGPFVGKISETFIAIKAEAKAAYNAAKDVNNNVYKMYFRDQDQALVKLVMKNVIRAINQYGPPIPVECVDGGYCNEGATAFASGDDAGPQSEKISLCRHILDGSDPSKRITTDFCVPTITKFSVAETFLHEIVHLSVISNGTRPLDYMYDDAACKQLRDGAFYLQDGRTLSPTENAQNFVMMAWVARHLQAFSDLNVCPMNSAYSVSDYGELRKLLGAGNATVCNKETLQPANVSATATVGIVKVTPVVSEPAFVKGTLEQDYLHSINACDSLHQTPSIPHILLLSPPNSSDFFP